ncbi:MAG: hypothetical protein A2W35_09120 [Chloroflexi bacterium RBG_16_57_11]|nr:MAG: hypothetical protein A2W35_09120 [Chloroflexi bacterium RBG_16_57_11]
MLPKPILAAMIALALIMAACKMTSQPEQVTEDTPESNQISGEVLYQRMGCAGCHTNAAGGAAPSLEGLYGGMVVLESGETILADESYLRESILSPSTRIVRGYQAIMPDFKGQISDEQVDALIEYIRVLVK